MQRLHLLHEDLGVVGHHVSVYHRPEGDVVACGLDVLVDKLPEALPPEAVHQLSHVPQRAANLLGQDLGVHHRPVVDGPAGDGRATLSDGPLEQACREGTPAISLTLAKTLFLLKLFLLLSLPSPDTVFLATDGAFSGNLIMHMLEEEGSSGGGRKRRRRRSDCRAFHRKLAEVDVGSL